MTANEHRDSAPKDWLDRLNASPDSGWLLFAGGCVAGVLLWLLVLYVPR